MTRFDTFPEWRAAALRRPFSCGIAAALLGLVSLVSGLAVVVFLYWGSTEGGGRSIIASLPAILGGGAVFFLTAPLFWRLEQAIAPKRVMREKLRANPVAHVEPFVFDASDFADPPDSGEFARIAQRAIPLQPAHSVIQSVFYTFLGLCSFFGGIVAFVVYESPVSWLSMVVSLGGLFLMEFGRRLGQPLAWAAIMADPRPPILFLRSFNREGAMKELFGIDDRPGQGIPLLDLLYTVLGRRSCGLESELARALRAHGPVVAIGQPGDAVSREGACRLYVSHVDWKAAVLSLICSSQMVVWEAGETEGLYWELAAIVKHRKPSSAVLIIPNPWLMQKEFEKFRRLANAVLPKPIPPTNQDFNLIMFDDEWAPVYKQVEYHALLLQPFMSSSLDVLASFQGVTPRLQPAQSPGRLPGPNAIALIAFAIFALAAVIYFLDQAR